jgi:cob(I)alamin adenosyltransferase
MSIATRTGDSGTTGLMYNRRVSKAHPRVEAYGSVDELNAAIGMARASSSDAFIGDNLLVIQKDLVIVMGELATAKEDTGSRP